MPKLILEGVTISNPEIIESKGDVLRFRATLQESNVKNRNGRYYPKEVLEEAIRDPRIQNLMRRRALFCEINHPIDKSLERQQHVDQRNVCCIIESMEWEGNLLKGVLATTANTIGKDLKGLIKENGYIPGFSLRATGDFHYDSRLGANVVDRPLTLFSFDMVQDPSHSNAIMESLLESSNLFNESFTRESFFEQQAVIFNEGLILDIPDPSKEHNGVLTKPVFNLTESYVKNVKKTHEFYAYSPNDKVTFNEDFTVKVEKEHTVKILDVKDFIKKDIAYNIYDFLTGKK